MMREDRVHMVLWFSFHASTHAPTSFHAAGMTDFTSFVSRFWPIPCFFHHHLTTWTVCSSFSPTQKHALAM